MTDPRSDIPADAGHEPSERTCLANGYYQVAPGKLVNAVTWLEMRSSPTSLPAKPLRLVSTADANRDVIRALFVEIGTPWLWSRAYDNADAFADTFLAQDDGNRSVGLFELSYRGLNEVEIVYFGLIPTAIGAGFGRRMMAAALDLAFRTADRVWLHTCSFDHPAALRFYVSCGFVPYATGFEIMDDPRLDGRLPRDAARHVPLIVPT